MVKLLNAISEHRNLRGRKDAWQPTFGVSRVVPSPPSCEVQYHRQCAVVHQKDEGVVRSCNQKHCILSNMLDRGVHTVTNSPTQFDKAPNIHQLTTRPATLIRNIQEQSISLPRSYVYR